MQNYRYPSQNYMRQNSCGCAVSGNQMQMRQQMVGKDGRSRDCLSEMPVAMAYVPWQEWRGIFDLEKGFCCGTIFEELHKPFQGMGVRC